MALKRRAWAVLALAVMMSGAAARAADASTEERERIRQVVKEVLREYAAHLGDRQAAPGARAVLREIHQHNRAFARSRKPAYFAAFKDGQRPRATVVSCADSRVHMHAFDATPDNDLFVVRNIGNQIATAQGSVEYGVRHLNTPLLLIVGHVACGAIRAAAGDYSAEPAAIRNELDRLAVPKDEPGLASIRLNVNHQVRHAMGLFEDRVLSGKLTVVGAIYDFRDELKEGAGRLVIVNVNGETDRERLARLDLLRDLDKPAAGGRRATP